jgi:hypothetical protein
MAGGCCASRREIQPSTLIVLQPVSWRLDFDQLVALFMGPELTNVPQAGAEIAQVRQQTFERASDLSVEYMQARGTGAGV